MGPPAAARPPAAGPETPMPIGWYIQSVSVPNGTTVPVTFNASIA